MGHEFTGEVVELGDGVKKFEKGDLIVTPFTISCGECFYCKKGNSSRCEKCQLYGTVVLDGGQAEYARIPLADSTVVKAPPGIDEKKLVLMADIFPTGYFAAYNAFKGQEHADIWDQTVVLIGCGPVAMCALVNALEYSPKHLLAVDSIPARLEQAKKLGAEPWNFKENMEGLEKRVKELTEGRGADAVIECVGHSDALQLGFKLLRPWGRISSIGVHNGEIPWTGNQAYGKNLTIQMGRCPVRSLFEKALKMLEKNQDKLEYVDPRLWFWKVLDVADRFYSFMIDNIRPMSQAVTA